MDFARMALKTTADFLALLVVVLCYALAALMGLGFLGGLVYTAVMLVLYALGLVEDWRWAK